MAIVQLSESVIYTKREEYSMLLECINKHYLGVINALLEKVMLKL